MKRIQSLFSGEGVTARALRGSGLTMIRFGGGNVLRLLSNLVLTRLLFPEAFGLMTLVGVFLTGLQMFSDMGINTSIIQSKRGDDVDFLNTAWTLKIIRGVLLWLSACALAPIAARIYDEPMLLALLPVAGLTLVITGFATTNVDTANRHLRLGRQTVISLGAQVFGIVVMVTLAFLLNSVWALVIGSLVTALVQVTAMHLAMPGIRNRLHWDPTAFREIFGFGKFIFLSTLEGFIIGQADRAILGTHITVAELGINNIGFFLGTFPRSINRAISSKVVFPLYRMRSPTRSSLNRQKIFRARRLIVAATCLFGALLAFAGPAMVEIMYDDRYIRAGGMVTLFSLAILPQLVLNGYPGAFLAHGDSRRFFYLLALTACFQVLFILAGIAQFGIVAAILAPGLATLATYPLLIAYVRRYNAWDAKGDFVFLVLGATANGLACWLHWDAIAALAN